jgi:hypothetical protein
MLRKLFFVVVGILVSVGTFGFIHWKNQPDPVVKAKRIQPWVESESLVLLPQVPEGGIAELTWMTLTDVSYKQVYVPELDQYYWKPTFGASVKYLEGREVFITGYVIPVEVDENFYVVSRYPYANCYFCGGGGPESVVDLRFAGKNRAYRTDERLTFKGKLKLNANDVYQMNYILENAVEYKP